MRAALAAAACLLLGAVVCVLEGARADDAKTTAVEAGDLPDDPARPLVQGKCLLCHTADYITQQRLTEGQWQRTVDKMRKFGTPASDEEAKAMVAYLARYWTVDLAPPRSPLAALPRGSVSRK
jgi:negative regulator of sigma E activity